jgi:phosphotransferase system enzyme I (PtsI)
VSRAIRGIGVSPGVAFAPALVVRFDFPEVPDRTVRPDQVDEEVQRLRDAVQVVVQQLRDLGEKVLRRAGPE